MTGLEYGNTRLRARRSALLDGGDYALLLTADTMERLLGLLSDTPFRSDVEAAVARHTGPQRLDAALRSHLARSLRDVMSFYKDPRVPEVLLLLERWDVRNLRLILRAQTHPSPGFDARTLLVPAGRLGEADLAELLAQDGVRSVIDLMVAWGLPTPATARRMVVARAEFEASGNAVVLEDALNRAYAGHLDELPEPDSVDEPSELLRIEIDAANVVAALRLVAAGQAVSALDQPDDESPFLPGGSMRHAVLRAMIRTASAEDAVALLKVERAPADWFPALDSWAEDGNLVRLEEALTAAISHRAFALMHRTDPLGPGVPVAYVFAKETEVRNLRWIGRGITHQLTRDEVAAHLVVAR